MNISSSRIDSIKIYLILEAFYKAMLFASQGRQERKGLKVNIPADKISLFLFTHKIYMTFGTFEDFLTVICYLW